jgi:hypothetical protein
MTRHPIRQTFPSSGVLSQRSVRLALAAFALAAAAGTILAGCGSAIDSPPRPASPAATTSTDFGSHELHYNAVRTDALSPEVARAYGIRRSPSRVMLNVALLARSPDGRTEPVDANVTATARNLNGQLKDLQMRRIEDGASVYFVGEVGIGGDEILVFDIAAAPRGGGERYTAQLRREFHAD